MMHASDPEIRSDSELVIHQVDRVAAIASRLREGPVHRSGGSFRNAPGILTILSVG